MTTTNTDPTTMTPVEVDTRIAELHNEIAAISQAITYATNRVLDHAGLRTYVSATWETRKSSYKVTGTFEDGVAILRAYETAYEAYRAAGYPQDQRPKNPSNYAGGVDLDATIAERDAAMATRYGLWTEANALEGEHSRRRWSRYFLVVSSAGHIHSSTGCNTCRWTTAYGWLPQMSGMTEAEAMDHLDTMPGASRETLCSVCFPAGPVAGRRLNITKAKATKLAASVVDTGDSD